MQKMLLISTFCILTNASDNSNYNKTVENNCIALRIIKNIFCCNNHPGQSNTPSQQYPSSQSGCSSESEDGGGIVSKIKAFG